jgi:hypothetical protein
VAGRTKTWVYLIGSPQARPVKIGSSFDPDSRLADLQVGSPVPLHVLWKTQGPRALEKSLHEYFAPYRSHGGWFDFGEEEPLPLVIAAAARMGFWTRSNRVSSEPEFVSRAQRRERWLAEHGDEADGQSASLVEPAGAVLEIPGPLSVAPMQDPDGLPPGLPGLPPPRTNLL